MNPILQAIEQGYSEDDILKYISKAIPKLVPKINKAMSSGYGIQQILGFLSKSSPQDTRGMSESQIHRRNRDLDSELSKKGLAIAAGSLAAPAAAQLTRNVFSRAMPDVLSQSASLPSNLPSNAVPHGTEIQQISQLPIGTAPTNTAQSIPSNPVSQQPPVNQLGTNIPQSPQTQQPKINITQLLNKHNSKGKVDDLIKSGNGAEMVAAYFKKFLPQIVKDIEKETGETFEDAIGRYAEEKQAAPQEQKSMEPEGQKLDVPKESGEVKAETKPIAKNETVASPQGVGEVREIRGDKALVEVDGKLHKVDVEDLEQEPEDVIETVQNLLNIPEVDRSSVVSLFTYDPSDNEMYIQFHTGDTYKYLDVDPEKVYAVANKMGIPVTKGKNIFGAWSPEDKKSLGATLIKEIINDPKYKKTKKGEEPNPNYRQLETLYDYWEKLRKKPKRKK